MDYKNLTDKQLKIIISELFEKFEDEDATDYLYDDSECFNSEVISIIE